jgi:GntR family transcriptional regulator, transcriptional repressor for pyruvate dehydrogenase complex
MGMVSRSGRWRPAAVPPVDRADLPAAAHFGRSAAGDIADQIRIRINCGQFGPRDRLPNERDLAVSLGVARITVREAIRLLGEEGYLVSKRGNSGGTFVSDLTGPQARWLQRIRSDRHWLRDLYEFRKAVEGRAALLAAQRRSRPLLGEMRAAVEAARSPATRSAFRQADHRFHFALARASGNERLVAATLHARGELFLPVDGLDYRDHFGPTAGEHEAILAAVEAGDGGLAVAAVEAHLDSSLQDLMDLVVRPSGRRPPAARRAAGG